MGDLIVYGVAFFPAGDVPAYLHINNLVVKKVPARAAGIEEAGEEGGKPYLLPGTQLWELFVFEKKVKIFSGRNWGAKRKRGHTPNRV